MAATVYVVFSRYGSNSYMIDCMISLSFPIQKTMALFIHSGCSYEREFWYFPTPSMRKKPPPHPCFETMGSSSPMTSKSLRIAFLPTPYLLISFDTVSFIPDSSIRGVSRRRWNVWSNIFSPPFPPFLMLIVNKAMFPIGGRSSKKFFFFSKISKVIPISPQRNPVSARLAEKSRYNGLASTACEGTQAPIFQISQKRKLEKICLQGAYPPTHRHGAFTPILNKTAAYRSARSFGFFTQMSPATEQRFL